MGKTLLLADDSVTIQKVVGISFASEDIAITTVDNGDDAIARAREMRPDVILADVVMPGKSGYEVCEAVKSDPELRQIPVLLLTGTFEAFDEERASRAGAAGHIAKPFEAQTLVERVKQLLAQAPAPAAAAPAAAPESDASGADNAFDFFDEPSGEAPEAEAGDFEIDEPDAAFAFGDDDLAAPPAQQPQKPPPAAHTVAILPDEPGPPEARTREPDPLPPPAPKRPSEDGRPAVPPPQPLPPLSAAQAESPPPLSAAQPETPPPPSEAPRPQPEAPPAPPEPSSPAAAVDEGFDFEFESVASSSAPAPAPSAESEGLAESKLLDPAGDSAFDVSSSDLGDLSVPEPEPEPVATQLMDVLPVEPPASAAAPEPAAAADGLADPLEEDSVSPAPGFVEEVPTGSAADVSDPMEFAPEEPAVAAAPPEPAPQPAPRPQAAEQAGKPAFAPAPVGVATPDEALAQIAPALREQLHETLEKIAWEAFGQVTETVVEQAVERLEKVAWEVVPKLAETLIQEEIRKLKSE